MPQHPALPTAIAQLRALVAMDTTSHKSNLELIHYVEALFSTQNVQSSTVWNGDGKKASLLGTLGGIRDGGIVLSGHTDVVPVEGQPWETDPFTLAEKDGLLYGRGTCDMKGFIACALALIPDFHARANQPVHFAFSYDEEIGCLSAPQLAAHISEQAFKPAMMIIGEPTLMEVVDAHKSIHSYITTITGIEGHSSNPQRGVNAVYTATELVTFLMQLGEEMKAPGKLNARFEPPYTTVHVGKMQGGTARNIIPNHAEIWWEMRGLPNEDLDALFARFDALCREKTAAMHAINPKAGISTAPQSRVPGLASDPNNPALPAVLRACGHNHTHAVSFATEAGIFQRAGFNALVCGPGSIAQAHKSNEFVAIEQLNQCLWFLDTLICRPS